MAMPASVIDGAERAGIGISQPAGGSTGWIDPVRLAALGHHPVVDGHPGGEPAQHAEAQRGRDDALLQLGVAAVRLADVAVLEVAQVCPGPDRGDARVRYGRRRRRRPPTPRPPGCVQSTVHRWRPTSARRYRPVTTSGAPGKRSGSRAGAMGVVRPASRPCAVRAQAGDDGCADAAVDAGPSPRRAGPRSRPARTGRRRPRRAGRGSRR